MDDLANKKIIVTGCASGIGAATAEAVRDQGGYVIGVDLTESEKVDEFHQADLSNVRSIETLVKTLPDGIHGLANIAGLPPTQVPAMVLKVNFVGLKYLTCALIPKLARGASIVNLASLAGFGWAQSLDQIKALNEVDFDDVENFVEKYRIADDQSRSYFLSKEALIVWTMQNRWTWNESGIRMNAVSPGPVETPLLSDFVQTVDEQTAANMAVMDRVGCPSEVAAVVAFMLSDAASWFRGTNLSLDGGLSSHILSNAYQL